MFKCTRFCVQQIVYDLFNQTKRYKGHSKWQNIRHTKGAADMEKSVLYNQFAQRIKLAAADGKGTNPELNMKLSHIIDEAKKHNMPLATIKGILQKIENAKKNAHAEIVDFRGPGNTAFILRLLTDNVQRTRMDLNSIFKKHFSVATDGKMLSLFHHQGFVITEIEVDLDTATTDAITAGAEDVEEVVEDGKFYKFTCEPSHLPKVTHQLRCLNYKIITQDEDYIPLVTSKPSDNDLKKIDALFLKLKLVEEIVSVCHNMETPETEEETKKP